MPTTSSSTSDSPPRSSGRRLADLSYPNLDDKPTFAGRQHHHRVPGQVIADRLADRIHAGALGDAARDIAGIAVTLHESHVASAGYERGL